ncbi:hypothetical protein OK016_27440 [Vibrio chagasii]|nr:hypothetical protein [Vibrio chagasii]
MTGRKIQDNAQKNDTIQLSPSNAVAPNTPHDMLMDAMMCITNGGA